MSNDLPLQPHGLEPLEPRALFSTYLHNTLPDFYGLGVPIQQVAAPGGAVGFGAAVVGLGDIDADGFDDFAIAAPGDVSGTPGGAAGSVFIYSARTQQLLRTISDGTPGFGISLADVGDVNADGVADLLIGSPWTDVTADSTQNPTGFAGVYSGADGSLLTSATGTTAFGEFGRVVMRAIDVNNDGVSELVIGAPASGDNGAGQVFVFSGSGGALLRTYSGTGAGERFGESIAALTVPGVTTDVYVAIGSPRARGDIGRVSVFRADGSLIYTLEGENPGDEFGASVALYADHTLPASPTVLDLAVGVPGADDYATGTSTIAPMRGRVDLYSSGTGASRGQFLGAAAGDRFGSTITSGPDLSLDGLPDLVLTSPGNPTFPFSIYAGAELGLIATPGDGLYRTSPALSASVIADAGDVNNDGIADYISGDGAGHVSIVSSVALGDTLAVTGASPNLQYVWSESQYHEVLFVNGVPTPYARIPGLASLPPAGDFATAYSRIDAILNDGTIIFHNAPRSGATRSELLVLVNGTSTPLSQLVTSVMGTTADPDYATFSVVRAGAGGHVLIADAGGGVWVYSGGVLHYLWHGTGADINAAGSVVGMQETAPALWTPDGGAAAIIGLDAVGAINDNGVVVGTLAGSAVNNNPGHLATWNDGVVTDIAPGPDVSSGTGVATWVFHAFDNDGRVLADVMTFPPQSSPFRDTYLFEPGAGLRRLGDVPYGLPTGSWGEIHPADPLFVQPVFGLGSGGVILAFDSIITPVAANLPFTLRDGAPVSNLSTDTTQYVVGVNIYGDVIELRNAGQGWTGQRLYSGLRAGDAVGLATTLMPRDENAPVVFVALADSLRVFRLEDMPGNASSGVLQDFNETVITRGLTVFTNAEGIVHVAGIDVNGDLVLYFRLASANGFTSSSNWIYVNLSRDHLATQGLSTPGFTGELSSFVTPWNGLNINGLGADGDVYSVWWTPGQTLWRIDDITDTIPGAGPLHGQISSFATPWGSLHVNGIGADGDIVALWWAPGFGGQWRDDKLVPGGIALDPASLVSFVTPWSGLNIAGRESNTSHVVVYWWSPESNQWRADPLAFRDDPLLLPQVAGRLSASVSANGTMSIAARGALSEAYRFSWQPGDANLWTEENLSNLAM